jgi:hypothetical protein
MEFCHGHISTPPAENINEKRNDSSYGFGPAKFLFLASFPGQLVIHTFFMFGNPRTPSGSCLPFFQTAS